MYNIDWSDDVATENVKEQFATLRPHLRNYSKFSKIFKMMIRAQQIRVCPIREQA